MAKFNNIKNEERRVSILKSYKILDSPLENHFEDLIFIASVICEVPHCYIGFIDNERIWLKSKIGLDIAEIPLESSLCKHVLESGNAHLIEDIDACDFSLHPAFVWNGKKVRFYFGLPLKSPEGFILGTLCLMDTSPRTLNEKQILGLSAISRHVIQVLIQRKSSMQNSLSNKTSALGMFSFSMAHEINNALFVSKAYLNKAIKLTTDEHTTEKKLHHFLSEIERSNSRISRIVNGIKIFSRNAQADPLELCSVRKIIEETLSICEKKCLYEKISLSTKMPAENLFIKCHPSEIIQVLINLINNSIDALSEVTFKWIELEIKVIEDSITFTVKDGGRGIPREIAQNLTQQFFTTKNPGKGTGLGLYICKTIIEHHSGNLFFDSNLPTTFGFTLPLKL